MSRLPRAGRPEDPTQMMFILEPKKYNICRNAMKSIECVLKDCCTIVAINQWGSPECTAFAACRVQDVCGMQIKKQIRYSKSVKK